MAQETGEQLYEAYYMRVFSYAMTLCQSRPQAEEITQETFFRALSPRNGFRGEADPLTWLCAIAKNLFLDEKRRQGRQQPLPEDVPAPGRGRALHALEEPYREVFELRIFGELSFREVGEIFGKTENWARVTYHRARLKLRERMEEHGL